MLKKNLQQQQNLVTKHNFIEDLRTFYDNAACNNVALFF